MKVLFIYIILYYITLYTSLLLFLDTAESTRVRVAGGRLYPSSLCQVITGLGTPMNVQVNSTLSSSVASTFKGLETIVGGTDVGH